MKKRKIGVCGVDSGQILICDPCYINSTWVKREYSVQRPIRIKKTGKIIDFEEKIKAGISYETPLPEFGGQTMNQLVASGECEAIDADRTNEFSYDGCSRETLSKDRAGQLNFPLGHAGAGVVASSGYGDGEYPVYAYFNKEGRIVKLEIVFTGTYTEKAHRKMTGANKK